MQFYAVHSDALALTHDALQRHCQQQALRPVGPTRVLRVAQLYGHLQLRAAGRERFSLALSELAASWRLQPRQLRQDLELLQQLGWLRASGTSRGTVIELLPPQLPAPAVEPAGPEAREPASPQAAEPATATAPSRGALAAAPADPPPAEPPPAAPAPVVPAPAVGPSRRCAASSRCEGRALLQHLAGLYNQHRPASWPAYQPRGTALLRKVRLALRQAGGPDALAAALTSALAAMPPFWRHTYPQGRSGAECMAVLFHSDRACAGLGVEFWHLFRWAEAAAAAGAPPLPAIAGATTASENDPAGATAPAGPLLQRAQRLFLWESGQWRGQGTEALRLPLAEKRTLAQLLEAHGEGIAGTAARQFAETSSPDPSPHAP